jgi:hypothetical protein
MTDKAEGCATNLSKIGWALFLLPILVVILGVLACFLYALWS